MKRLVLGDVVPPPGVQESSLLPSKWLGIIGSMALPARLLHPRGRISMAQGGW